MCQLVIAIGGAGTYGGGGGEESERFARIEPGRLAEGPEMEVRGV